MKSNYAKEHKEHQKALKPLLKHLKKDEDKLKGTKMHKKSHKEESKKHEKKESAMMEKKEHQKEMHKKKKK